jgi:hypothetical protein
VRRLRQVLGCAVAAGILAATSATAIAGAQSACGDLGGTLNDDRTCDAHVTTEDYAIDLSFPTSYPDQQEVVDYLIQLRDGFVDFAQSPPEHAWPYSLRATPITYQSGAAATGTASVVLKMSEDAEPHPVAWYKAFNYDLGTHAPMTLGTLFKPGVKPLDVVLPAVLRELEKRWQPEVLASMLGPAGDAAFENFALTDDAVIFFIGQGQLLGHQEGPLEVSVPRTELASSLT